MLKLLLIRIWPALIPVIVYIIWLTVAKRKAARNGENIPKFTDGPWTMILLSAFGLLILNFIILGIFGGDDGGQGTYVPPHMENGELVPGRIVPNDQQ